MSSKDVTIVGAGLVGSLLATMLSRKGLKVSVYEKRSDPRETSHLEGRSINLALSHRGIRALESAGVFDKIKDGLIPMLGRKMHDETGNLSEQPYGKEGQFINSVSRSGLNLMLIKEAVSAGVDFHFDHECKSCDLESSKLTFDHHGSEKVVNGGPIFGTDGAFSAIRSAYKNVDAFEENLNSIDHGYKELKMLPKNNEFAMEPNFLHIWPRGKFMLIALPNQDKTFTCTLFLPFEGEMSFSSLESESEIESFFKEVFPDVPKLIPDFVEQFQTNPTSSLVTLKCFPWVKNQTLLIGDASHAIVPFYGQGMNAGFEDCRLLVELAESLNWRWDETFESFQSTRKHDADAIADFALKNFVEMRDWVGDEKFLLRKKLEAALHDRYSSQWIPQYSMVTFSDIRYSDALRIANFQDEVLEKFLITKKNEEICDKDLGELIDKFNQLRKV